MATPGVGFLQLAVELLDVGLLLVDQAAHEVQVELEAGPEVALVVRGRPGPGATGGREGAFLLLRVEHLRSVGAVGLQVDLHLFPGVGVGLVCGSSAPVGADDGESPAGGVVGLQGVGGEAPEAVGAVYQPLGAGVDHVSPQPVPLDLQAALVLAVDRLEPAGGGVVVQGGPGEVLLAVGVWSLTQFYSVDFSKSRIAVKKCVFNKRTLKVCVSCC